MRQSLSHAMPHHPVSVGNNPNRTTQNSRPSLHVQRNAPLYMVPPLGSGVDMTRSASDTPHHHFEPTAGMYRQNLVAVSTASHRTGGTPLGRRGLHDMPPHPT